MTITVCPECDSPHIESVVAAGFGARSVAHAYRCNDCGARFDTACERPAHHSGGQHSRHGLAKMLAEADADDLVSDGGTDAPHYCEICETAHETLASLIRHECSSGAVTDGGTLPIHAAEYACGDRIYFAEGEEHRVPTTCLKDDCSAGVSGVFVDE